MSIQLENRLSQFWYCIQTNLFPWLQEELGPLSQAHQQVIIVLEMARIEEFVQTYRGTSPGRPPACRAAMARAYVAKASLNLSTTRQLLDRLNADKVLRRICGWERVADIPDESIFSRAFKGFAQDRIPERVHEAMIKAYQSERLVGHISRDSTAIEAREKVAVAPEAAPVITPKKRGRPKKWARRSLKPKTRLERQLEMTSPTAMLADLPQHCDVGTKVDSKGRKISWRGYKLHIDTADGDIPISCVLTSASVHDSQVAIPLALMTQERVDNCYDLMDAAYDSGLIRVHSRSLGHAPLIDFNRRSEADTRAFEPHEARRYKERSSAERVNSRLKDSFGGRFLRVKGSLKAMAHLMFGIICLTAEQLVARIPQLA